MLSLHRRTWPRLYVDTLKEALKEGYARPSREGETVELGPAFLSCPAPTFAELVGRGGSSEFARLEQLCYLAGVDPEPVTRVAPRYVRFREDNGYWYGAYGPRLFINLSLTVTELERHPFSRRAVALVWGEADIYNIVNIPRRDIPCTVSLTFWVGPAGEVRCHVAMRSCDLWFGFYYDLPAFAFLQRAVARALGRPTGITYLTATSLHLYNKDLDRARYVRGKLIGDAVLVHPVLPQAEGMDANQRWNSLVAWARAQLDKEAERGTPVHSHA